MLLVRCMFSSCYLSWIMSMKNQIEYYQTNFIKVRLCPYMYVIEPVILEFLIMSVYRLSWKFVPVSVNRLLYKFLFMPIFRLSYKFLPL